MRITRKTLVQMSMAVGVLTLALSSVYSMMYGWTPLSIWPILSAVCTITLGWLVLRGGIRK